MGHMEKNHPNVAFVVTHSLRAGLRRNEKNASMYNDSGYMINAFNKGADNSAPLSLILAAVTDRI